MDDILIKEIKDNIDRLVSIKDLESLKVIKDYIEKVDSKMIDSDKYLFYSLNRFCDTFLRQDEKMHFKRRMIIDEIFSILSLNKDDFKTNNKAWYNRIPEDNLGNIFMIYQLLEISDSINFRLKNTTTLNRLKELLMEVGIPFEKLNDVKKEELKDKINKSNEEFSLKLKNKTF